MAQVKSGLGIRWFSLSRRTACNSSISRLCSLLEYRAVAFLIAAIFVLEVFYVMQGSPLEIVQWKENDKSSTFSVKPQETTTLPSYGIPVKRAKTYASMKKDPPTSRNIRQISLIGERNSGTNWITDHVAECFNHSLVVTDRLVRHKHWFQHDINNTARVENTLVISQFRNPCHWIESMRIKNHHAPMHYKTDWYTYVTTPWTMPRLDYDLELLNTYMRQHGSLYNASDISCQENFKFHEVNSCLKKPHIDPPFKPRKRDGMSGHEPFYELNMDGSGRAYPSILEMRYEKIHNFLQISEWEWIGEYILVRYEDLLEHGTQEVIDEIERLTGVKAKCTPFPPSDRDVRPLPKDFVQWMTRYANWDVESLVGYHSC